MWLSVDRFKYIVLVETPRTLTKRCTEFTATTPHLYLSVSLPHTKPQLLSGKQRGQKQQAGKLNINGKEYHILLLFFHGYNALIVEANLCSAESYPHVTLPDCIYGFIHQSCLHSHSETVLPTIFRTIMCQHPSVERNFSLNLEKAIFPKKSWKCSLSEQLSQFKQYH